MRMQVILDSLFARPGSAPICGAGRKESSGTGLIVPLHDPVTWYKIKYTGEQVAQWDFQNKGRSRWTGMSCFVLEVPLCNLLTSKFNFVPCDRIVQRAYCAHATSVINHSCRVITLSAKQ